MKWIKVFGVFLVLHGVAWVAAHVYKSGSPDKVLIVADTSFALKPQFVNMQRWIEDYSQAARYSEVLVGTDKAFIGPLDDLKSRDVIFRSVFGRSDENSLLKYANQDVEKRIFLSDGSFEPAGWDLVSFQ